MSEINTEKKKRVSRSQWRPRVPVKVTRQHIDQSMQKNSSHCMIAEAIKEAIPNAQRISVDLQTIRWTDPEKGLRYLVLTPRWAQVKLIAFDQGDLDNLEPFEFTLRPNQITKSGKNTLRHAPDDPVKSEYDETNVDGPVVARKPNRQRLTAPQTTGSIPVTLGGARPPLSVLTRREFGLRALRK